MTASPPWSRARLLAALLLVPVLLFAPMIAAGQVFLPFLPVVSEPLASEYPAEAAVALGEVHATMGDRVYPFLTDQLAARAELGAGHLPTWEPLATLGMPLFGGNVAALGYPPNWLGLLLPPERAAAPLALLSLFLAGLGTWLFLRRLELDPRACLVGALGVQLGGWGLANLFYYMKVDAALWLPWALWSIEGLARTRRWSASALVAALTLSFLGGMVSIAVFVLGASALYALVRLGPWRQPAASASSPSRGLRPLARVALLLALGVAGSAYWTWPVAEAARASLRAELGVDAAVASSLPPTSALGVLVPDLAGPPGDPSEPSNLPIVWWLTPRGLAERAHNANVLEWSAYALVVVALLALVGLVADPRRACFPAALLLGCFAFAQAWPVVRLLYAVPGLGLGAPQRVLALTWILWPWLAALGVAALLARLPRALPTLLTGALLGACALLVAWQRLEPEAWARALQATILERYGERTTQAEVSARLPLEAGLAAGRHLSASLLRAGSAALALFLAAAAALFLDRRAPRFEEGPGPAALWLALLVPLAAGALPLALRDDLARGPQALLGLSAALALTALAARTARTELVLWLPCAALLVLEGFLGSAGHVRGRELPRAGLFPPSPTIEAIREAAGDGRVLRLDPTGTLADSLRLARPNLLLAYGIGELTPYPTFTPAPAAELAAALDPRMRQRNHVASLPALELVAHPLLDLLRVTCLLSVAPLQHARLAPLLERPGFCVYRRLGALPPARIVPAVRVPASDAELLSELSGAAPDFAERTRIAPADAARLEPFTPGPDWQPGTLTAVERPAKNALRLRVSDSRGGWLVLHEQWAAGWRARIGPQDVPVLRADHAYRAVAIPSGDFVLEFRYEPRALEWGAVVTLLTLLGVLAWDLLHRD